LGRASGLENFPLKWRWVKAEELGGLGSVLWNGYGYKEISQDSTTLSKVFDPVSPSSIIGLVLKLIWGSFINVSIL